MREVAVDAKDEKRLEGGGIEGLYRFQGYNYLQKIASSSWMVMTSHHS